MDFLIPEIAGDSELTRAKNSLLLDVFGFEAVERYVPATSGAYRVCFISTKVGLVRTLSVYEKMKTSPLFTAHVPELRRIGLCKYRRKYFLEYDVSNYLFTNAPVPKSECDKITAAFVAIGSPKILRIEECCSIKTAVKMFIVTNFRIFNKLENGE